jgi:hypothetical protein
LAKRDRRLFWRDECSFARAWDHLAIGKIFYPQNPLKVNIF